MRRVEAPTWACGLPVTPVGLTLVELGHELDGCWATGRRVQRLRPDERVELALEHALRIGATTAHELEALLNGSCRNRAGARLARSVLARRGPGVPATESYLETRGVQVLRNGGLVEFDRQVEVVHPVRRMRVDLICGRAIIEFDGREPHDPQFRADRERWNLLRDLGYDLRIFTWDDVEHEPARMVALATLMLSTAA
jgi:very-short-patch-repair endonuclease